MDTVPKEGTPLITAGLLTTVRSYFQTQRTWSFRARLFQDDQMLTGSYTQLPKSILGRSVDLSLLHAVHKIWSLQRKKQRKKCLAQRLHQMAFALILWCGVELVNHLSFM